jgi:homoserine kinase
MHIFLIECLTVIKIDTISTNAQEIFDEYFIWIASPDLKSPTRESQRILPHRIEVKDITAIKSRIQTIGSFLETGTDRMTDSYKN